MLTGIVLLDTSLNGCFYEDQESWIYMQHGKIQASFGSRPKLEKICADVNFFFFENWYESESDWSEWGKETEMGFLGKCLFKKLAFADSLGPPILG